VKKGYPIYSETLERFTSADYQ